MMNMSPEEKRLHILNERIKEAKKIMSILRKHSNGGLLPAADGSVEKLSTDQIDALKKHLPSLLGLLEDLDYVEEEISRSHDKNVKTEHFYSNKITTYI